MSTDWIDESLREDREEALEHGEVVASEAAVEMCKRLDYSLLWPLRSKASWKRAVFGEVGGGVSLVLRSPIPDRRVDFRIAVDGMSIMVVAIDEHVAAGKCSLICLRRRLSPSDAACERLTLLALEFLGGDIVLAQWKVAMQAASVGDSRGSIYGESEDR